MEPDWASWRHLDLVVRAKFTKPPSELISGHGLSRLSIPNRSNQNLRDLTSTERASARVLVEPIASLLHNDLLKGVMLNLVALRAGLDDQLS